MKAPCTFGSGQTKVTLDAYDVYKVEEQPGENNKIYYVIPSTKDTENILIKDEHNSIIIRLEKAVRDHTKAVRTEREISDARK